MVVLLWLYTLSLVLWFCLHRAFGDRIWWLALLSPFAPLFFLPIVPWIFTVMLVAGAANGLSLIWWLPILVMIGVVWITFRQQVRFGKPQAVTQNMGTLFTLMTFNIWWSSKQPLTARVPLTNNSPHIVALQELTPHMAHQLDNELSHLYPHRSYATSNEQNASRLGLISKFPMEVLDSSHMAQRDFRIQIVRVTLPSSQTVLVYNIHPRATNVIRFWRVKGGFAQKVEESFSNRMGFFQRMLTDVKSRTEPVIVTGDCNSTPLSDIYRLMSRYLRDAHVAAGKGLGHTFPAHTKDLLNVLFLRKVMRLDMVFCSKELTIARSQVGHTSGESDHLPVTATLWLGADRQQINN